MTATLRSTLTIDQVNQLTQVDFVAHCGPFFECSPWVAERTWNQRPFADRESLHGKMVATVRSASEAEQLALVQAHPDLVGKLARQGVLTSESTSEQTAAGLNDLTPAEVGLFDKQNAAYHNKFGFPFVICARENKKAAILAAFPIRLQHTREQEMITALQEIAKIARLRLCDAIAE